MNERVAQERGRQFCKIRIHHSTRHNKQRTAAIQQRSTQSISTSVPISLSLSFSLSLSLSLFRSLSLSLSLPWLLGSFTPHPGMGKNIFFRASGWMITTGPGTVTGRECSREHAFYEPKSCTDSSHDKLRRRTPLQAEIKMLVEARMIDDLPIRV